VTYESLVTFPKIFRRMAAELKPKHVSESDVLALLIARTWLEQQAVKYKTMPFEMSADGGLALKAAVQYPDPDPRNRSQWLCRIIGIQGSVKSAVGFRLPAVIDPQYTHLWLWLVHPTDHFAHHWRGRADEMHDWGRSGSDRVLSLRALLEENPVR